MREAYIFGAGNWGRQASICFENEFKIRGFLDNDEKKQGTVLEGKSIFSPAILEKNKNAIIIIAVANDVIRKEIEKQLRTEYHIDGAIIYEAYWSTRMLQSPQDNEEQLIVNFRSGLGNQMFQYALYKWLECKGKRVFADMSDYTRFCDAKFILGNVFQKIDIKKCDANKRDRYYRRYMYGDKKIGFIEQEISDERNPINYENIARMNKGVIIGYFQSHRIADEIREELISDFQFDMDTDLKLINLVNDFAKHEYISVHIRRGDYLRDSAKVWFGDICTEEYYRQAIDYMKQSVPKSRFVFFSDDIEWVKKKYVYKDAIYVQKSMFCDYEDWYDMLLMSKCSHNIIANSTFSWWGAWLNQNRDKIIIAPKRWANYDAFKDICPTNWIRI